MVLEGFKSIKADSSYIQAYQAFEIKQIVSPKKISRRIASIKETF